MVGTIQMIGHKTQRANRSDSPVVFYASALVRDLNPDLTRRPEIPILLHQDEPNKIDTIWHCLGRPTREYSIGHRMIGVVQRDIVCARLGTVLDLPILHV
jgi:hypothetical protein